MDRVPYKSISKKSFLMCRLTYKKEFFDYKTMFLLNFSQKAGHNLLPFHYKLF